MARAEITTVDGIILKVTGTPDDIAKILDHAREPRVPAGGRKATPSKRLTTGKQGLPELLQGLREEKYFKEKRALANIRERLAEVGSHYSAMTLGKQLLREVRGRRLRRLKDDGKWVYVQ